MSKTRNPVRYGITSLRDLRERCVIETDTDCWIFKSLVRRPRRKEWGCNVWLAHLQRAETLPRSVWLLSGRPLTQGLYIWRTCRHPRCGNPAHLLGGTKHDHGLWQAQAGYLRGLPERRAINRRNIIGSARVVMTEELAAWARESAQTGLDVAHALSVSPQCVSRVRRGQTWRPLVAAASVFAWAGGIAGR